MKHAVVILNYNNAKDTIACLKSIDKCEDKPHVIVVDNASTDDSISSLYKAYPKLDLISSPSNQGFSSGNNLGIKHALELGAEVVYLLNNDTIVKSDLFKKAYKYVAGKEIIAGAKIYYAKGYEYHSSQKNKGNVLWYAGGHYDDKNAISVHDHIDEIDKSQANAEKQVDFITGCFMAIPKSVFDKIGYLDSSFFLYLEDTDYSLRAKEFGIELWYNPHLVVYHKNGGTSGAGSSLVDYYMTRNRFVIGFRHGNLKLKLALLKEALTRNITNTNRRQALLDFIVGRLGKREDFNFAPLVKLLVLGTVLGVLSLLYVNLGRDTLFNWDEGIYAELGRELLIKKDILTSYWNDAVWLEKPPAISWIVALGMSIFGKNEFGARSLMPVFAVLTLTFVYKIGRKLGGWRYGLIAMSLLSTFDLFLARSRAVNTDGMLLSALTATIYFALSNGSAFLVALGIFAGVMTKGIAGLLIAAIILPLILKRGILYTFKVAVISIIALVPWHLYQYFVNGSTFYTPYLLEQVLRRATVPIEFHMESRYYYFNFLIENLRGGTLYLLILAVLVMVYFLIAKKKMPKDLILLWWLFIPLIIFTLAKTRLYWYILPIYPSIALLISSLFARFDTTKTNKLLLSVLAIGLSYQAIISVSRSVEIDKKVAKVPDQIVIAKSVSELPSKELYVLVPKSERTAEAILPEDQRLGSSFRYGGAPNLVFYSQKKITYFYNLDDWREALIKNQSIPVMLDKADLLTLPTGYVVTRLQGDYIMATKGEYDLN